MRYLDNTHEFLSNKTSTTLRQLPLAELNNINTCTTFDCNVNDAKWTSNEHFLVGQDSGEVTLMKIVGIGGQPNMRGIFYETRMTRVEHDGAIICLATLHDFDIALSGSIDSTYVIYSYFSKFFDN